MFLNHNCYTYPFFFIFSNSKDDLWERGRQSMADQAMERSRVILELMILE